MREVLQRIITLVIKEFILIWRDPKSRTVVIVPPLIQFFIFSYAATFDLLNVPYAVFDESRTVESRTLLNHFSGSKHFDLKYDLNSAKDIPDLINNSEVRLVLRIPRNFAKDIHEGSGTAIQVIADGRNSNVASIALGYVEEIVQSYIGTLGQNQAPFNVVSRSWFNENLETRWYIVSALGGIISMVIVMVLASLSVAREREFGTFDQLLVSPFKSAEILIGKAVPCMFFGVFEALLLAVFAIVWFQVPFRGSIAALLIVLCLFMISVVGVGLFISAMSVTMQQGLLGSFVFIMPAVLLGGFTTPIENMPQWLQWATVINPLRYVVRAMREIFLMGADTMMVWPEIWPMMLIACVTMPVAAMMFRSRTR